MQSVLITGGTGFIGGFLIEEAIRQGYKVVATVRKSSNVDYLKSLENVTIKIVDLSKPQEIAAVLDDFDVQYFIHNAGLTKAKTEAQMNKVNAAHLRSILEGCTKAKNKIKRLVHISSLAAYGPADFTESGIVTNNTSPRPVTMYGRSKLKGEKILTAQKDIPYVIIRPSVVFGPKEKDLFTIFKMIAQGIQTKVGFKDQKLTFIYVKDLVIYMVNALNKGKDNQAYFIANDGYASSHELNEMIRKGLDKKTLKLTIPIPIIKILGFVSEYWGKLTGSLPPLNIDKVNEIKAQSWVCDIKPNHNLGHKPKYDMPSAIKETIDWYKENKWLK